MPENPQDPNDWIRYSNLNDTERAAVTRSCARGAAAWRIGLACGTIALGVFLFLGNIGVIPAYNIWSLWPLLPIAGGISRVVGDHSTGRGWGVFMILIGALFLSLNLGWIHIHASGSWIFPLILIGIGCMALFGVLDSSPHPRMRFARARAHFARSFEADNVVGDFALLGSVKRKLETNDFRGGGLATILGSVEIDLRLSAITVPENTAVLNANAIFGAIKLRVPQYWRVHLHGMSILGNFEDKTVPPNTGPNAPVLVITGWSIFGSVEVED